MSDEDDQNDMFGDDDHGNDLSKYQALSDVDRDRWPHTMAELVDVFTAEARRHSMAGTEDAAGKLARWVVLVLAEHFGGRQAYLPKGKQLKEALRDTQIWQDFKGQNHDELAKKYDLTVVRIYSIVNRQLMLHRTKVQPQLPFDEGSNAR